MGNQGSVKSHIENAERTGVFALPKAGVSEFPKDIARLQKSCRSLDLSSNKIKAIPGALGTFSQLKQLNMNSNRIASLPDELGGLKKLETLSLNHNLITTIPLSFESLSALKILNLSENQITVFPAVLAKLKNLDVVDLSKNRITEVPDSISGLQATEVNFNQNQISRVSDEVVNCRRLKVLRLEENCLTLQSISPKVLRDSQVSILAIDGNLFEIKDFQNTDGYDAYMERYTASKKKIF